MRSIFYLGHLLILFFALGCSPLLHKEQVSRQNQSHYFKVGNVGEFVHHHLRFRVILLDQRIRVGHEASFRLHFWRAEGNEEQETGIYPGSEPEAWFWMVMPSGEGHPPSREGNLSLARNERGESISGTYDFTGVVFNMPGEWEIHIRLRNLDGIFEDVVQTISI